MSLNLNLTRADKFLLMRLLEDRINDLYTILLDIIQGEPDRFKKNIKGIIILIRDNIAVLEKVTKDLNIKTEYNSEWYKLLLEKSRF